MKYLKDGLIALLATIVGFAFGTAYDSWRRSGETRAELVRAIRSIEQEISIDNKLIDNNINILTKDIEVSSDGKEVVAPPDTLLTMAGDMAYLKGSFEIQSIDFAMRLREIYSSLILTNNRIQARELYLFTSESMSNFGTRRSIIDGQILELLTRNKTDLTGLLANLKSME
jgi:hypothetical protein